MQCLFSREKTGYSPATINVIRVAAYDKLSLATVHQFFVLVWRIDHWSVVSDHIMRLRAEQYANKFWYFNFSHATVLPGSRE